MQHTCSCVSFFFALSPPLLQVDIFTQQKCSSQKQAEYTMKCRLFFIPKKLRLPHNHIKKVEIM